MNLNNLSLLDVALFSPRSLKYPNSWVGHLPFAAWVIKEVSPKIFVELGTHSGNSYFAFCQSVRESGIASNCYAVDTWEGDEHAGRYDDEVFGQVNSYNNEHYADFSRLLRMTFDSAVSYFADESIDLLHIDGLHIYKAVRHDFESWLPKLAPGAVVMFHDTNVRERNFGVWKLFEELKIRYPNNLEFMHSHGLGVLQLNNTPDAKKLGWLQPHLSEKQRFIKYFATLGLRQLERYELNELKTHVSDLSQVVIERDGQIANLNQTVAERDGQIAYLNQTVAERDGQIAYLNQTVAECNGQIANLDQAVGERDVQIAKFKQTVAELNHSVAERGKEIAGLRNSTSWRITIPLRFVSLLLRGKHKETHTVASTALEQVISPVKSTNFALAQDLEKLPSGFDPDMYLKINPDVAESGDDSINHYSHHGHHEGRIFALPDSGIDYGFKVGRETILVVSHEASRTGAPVLSLNIVQAFVETYNVVVLLLGGGPLVDAFRRAGATVMTLSNQNGAEQMVDQLCGRFNFKFALVNSIESRVVLSSLCGYFVPTISLIHEFASYTRPRGVFREALFWSGEVVFSANVTLENALAEYPDMGDRLTHIFPQGRCILPLGGLSEEQIQTEREHIRRLIRPENIAEDSVVVLGAGYVQLRKGVDLFIECAARVVQAPEGDRCRFVWIGKGFDPDNDIGYSVYLADQINRAGLQEHVFFVDETSAIETAYEETDLLLLSSRLDPLPNVAIDAMAHGVPVLCFNKTTGIADFLIDCGLGNDCVAEYLDSTEMAEKILALAGSQILRESVAARCREASIIFFNMKDYIARLEVLAHGVCERTRQEKADTEMILSSGLLRQDFTCPPHRQFQSIETEVCRYVRAWASEIDRRKPFPGFHPSIYLEQHGLATHGADPFADYLRAGRPEGPWNYPVIVAGETKKMKLPGNRRVALHLHVYYPDLLPEITTRLSRNRICPDLFVSINNEEARKLVISELKDYKGRVIDIQLVPNRGRDIGSFLTAFGPRILANYDFVGHIHTKKTADVKDAVMAETWYRFLLENLLGGESGVMADSILAKMKNDTSIGMVFPDDPYVVGWDANRAFAESLAVRLGLQELPESFIFPVGTMFWARTSALAPLMDLKLDWDDYPEEPLPYDGTLLHAIERLFSLILSIDNLRCATTNVIGLTR